LGLVPPVQRTEACVEPLRQRAKETQIAYAIDIWQEQPHRAIYFSSVLVSRLREFVLSRLQQVQHNAGIEHFTVRHRLRIALS
jgi:hypothetical protein